VKSIDNYFIDAHVHYHSCFDPKVFFDSAYANFQRCAQKLRLGSKAVGCLFFTETSKDHYFRAINNDEAERIKTSWTFQNTLEDYSLIVRKESSGADHRAKMIIVAGRQIVTAEGVEVLALGCNSEFSDGLAMAETIQEVRQHDAIPVIPWGFGKWWGKRGRVVSDCLAASSFQNIFLGDNWNRPQIFSEPPHFKLGTSKKVSILPGTDALPFKEQSGTTGQFGFILTAEIDLQRPGASLKKLIRSMMGQNRIYGNRQRLRDFLRYQAAMQCESISKKYFSNGSFKSSSSLTMKSEIG